MSHPLGAILVSGLLGLPALAAPALALQDDGARLLLCELSRQVEPDPRGGFRPSGAAEQEIRFWACGSGDDIRVSASIDGRTGACQAPLCEGEACYDDDGRLVVAGEFDVLTVDLDAARGVREVTGQYDPHTEHGLCVLQQRRF